METSDDLKENESPFYFIYLHGMGGTTVFPDFLFLAFILEKRIPECSVQAVLPFI